MNMRSAAAREVEEKRLYLERIVKNGSTQQIQDAASDAARAYEKYIVMSSSLEQLLDDAARVWDEE